MKVLIADDHRDTADCLALAAETMGHAAHVAYSEVQALDALANHGPFDALIFDLDLPPGPPAAGALLLERLRNSGNEAPAALITGHPEEMVESARLRCAKGAWGRVVVLRKPFDVGELVRELEAMRTV